MTESDSEILLSVIIPNYNGAGRLGACLDRALESLDTAKFEWEIIVVDDASPDGSADIARDRDGVTLIEQKENRGFGATCNLGAARARGDIIFLLNNDVEVESDFRKTLLPHFKDEDVFAVACHAYDENGRTVAGRHVPGFVSGFLKPVVDPEPPSDAPSTTIYASGGAAAFRRDLFVAIGGFDPLYHPFYWEDFDLGYRAWKRGLRVIYEPRSRVLHRSHGVIRSAHNEDFIGRVNRRNQLICNWKNLTDSSLRNTHFAVLGLRTAANTLTFRTQMLPIIRDARSKRAYIRAARAAEAPHIRRSDMQVFRLFQKKK